MAVGEAGRVVPMLLPIMDLPGFSHLEKVGVAAYAFARAGRMNEAKAMLKRAESPVARQSTQRGMVAAALDAVGEREKVIEVLGKAVDDKDLWRGHTLGGAPYDGLRKDPRARALFARMSSR